jgi:hypothetical protein
MAKFSAANEASQYFWGVIRFAGPKWVGLFGCTPTINRSFRSADGDFA